MIKTTYTIECDNSRCNNTLTVEQITDYKKRGWHLVPNPPMCKGMDEYYCPECFEEAEVRRMKLYRRR